MDNRIAAMEAAKADACARCDEPRVKCAGCAWTEAVEMVKTMTPKDVDKALERECAFCEWCSLCAWNKIRTTWEASVDA